MKLTYKLKSNKNKTRWYKFEYRIYSPFMELCYIEPRTKEVEDTTLFRATKRFRASFSRVIEPIITNEVELAQQEYERKNNRKF